MPFTAKLRLPAKLKFRIGRAARRARQSPHQWMLETLERETERKERFLTYVRMARRQEDLVISPGDEVYAGRQFHLWLEKVSTDDK